MHLTIHYYSIAWAQLRDCILSALFCGNASFQTDTSLLSKIITDRRKAHARSQVCAKMKIEFSRSLSTWHNPPAFHDENRRARKLEQGNKDEICYFHPEKADYDWRTPAMPSYLPQSVITSRYETKTTSDCWCSTHHIVRLRSGGSIPLNCFQNQSRSQRTESHIVIIVCTK